MSTNDLKLSSALVLKLREYHFSNDQMIAFALSLSSYFDVIKLSDLMKADEISFNFNIDTKIFELLDPYGLMGSIEKIVRLNNFIFK